MISESYCGDFEGGYPGRCETWSDVDEGDETLAPRGDRIIVDDNMTVSAR
jgi:hypothetical protein